MSDRLLEGVEGREPERCVSRGVWRREGARFSGAGLESPRAEGGLLLYSVHLAVASRDYVCGCGILEDTVFWTGNPGTVAYGGGVVGGRSLEGRDHLGSSPALPRPGQTFPGPWGRAGEITWWPGRAWRTPPLRPSPAAAADRRRVAAADSQV